MNTLVNMNWNPFLKFRLFFIGSLCLLGTTSTSWAQQDTVKYWIQFTDKNNSTYSVQDPQYFLSDKAIARRTKFNIPITEQDIPVNEAYIQQVLSYPSVRLLNPSKWFNAITISCYDTNELLQIQQLACVKNIETVQKLKRKSEIEWKGWTIEESEKSGFSMSNTPHYPYGFSFNQLHLHHVDFLHQLGFQGKGMTIAVIDAGFENATNMACFEHLFAENKVLSTKDFVAHDGNVYNDHYHGAAVLSVMAGKIDGEYLGAATEASFHLLRSEDADSEFLVEEDNWVSAAEYADSAGADIINSSLGYTTFDDSTQNHTYADADGNTTRVANVADIAASKGILVVCSAGNSGNDSWKYISTPADADSILTVGAVDSLGNYASFSSVGPSSDGEVKPTVASVGKQTYLYIPSAANVVQGNGTSFSSPMMAGMVACFWQAFPSLKNGEIIELMKQSANQFSSPDSLLGYGIPDFRKAYHIANGFLPKTIEFELMDLFPNPLSEENLTALLFSSQAQTIHVQISNTLGQEMYNENISVDFGQNKLTLTHSLLPKGIYAFQVTPSFGERVCRLLVVW